MQAIPFTTDGTAFCAYYAAERWAKANGYTLGSMEQNKPIGLHKGAEYISKWSKMTKAEQESLDGTIRSADFRNGPVTIYLKEA